MKFLLSNIKGISNPDSRIALRNLCVTHRQVDESWSISCWNHLMGLIALGFPRQIDKNV